MKKRTGCWVLLVLVIGCVSPMEQGGAFYSSGRYAEAISSYQQAIYQEPGNQAAYRGLGLAYNAAQQYPLASRAFGQALRLDPRDYVSHYNLGVSFHYTGQYYPAIREFDYAVQLQPALFGAYYEIGELCAHLYQYECAIFAFTLFLQRTPNGPQQRNAILRANYQVRSLSAELAYFQAQEQIQEQAVADEEDRRAAQRLQQLDDERQLARRQAASVDEQRGIVGSPEQTPDSTASAEGGFTDKQQAVLAIVAAGGCEAARREGEKNKGIWASLEQYGGMACRNRAVETALEKLFPQMTSGQRGILTRVVGLVVEGDFASSSVAREVGREELLQYVSVKTPDLEANAKVLDFLYDVYLQKAGR